MPDSSRDPLFHENGYFDGDYPWPYSPLGNSNEIENAHIQGSNNGFNPWIPSQGEHSRSPPEDPFSRLEYDLAGVLPSPGYAAHKGLMSSGPSVLHVPPTDVPSRIPEVTFNLSSSDAPRIPTMDSSPELFVSRPSRTNNLDYVSATTSAAAPSSAIPSRRRRHPSGSLSVVMPGRVEETATPLSPHLGLPFGEGTNEENLLMTLRDAGHGFTYISQQMHEQLGIEITSNALVKRYGKIQNMYMTVLPKAVSNQMPLIMSLIKDELEREKVTANGVLSEAEIWEAEQILNDLPQSLPKWLQNVVNRKRRNAQPPRQAK